MRSSWRVWLGFGISLIFIYFALRGQDFSVIAESLRSADYRWLLPALMAYFAGVGVRAVRWAYLLRPIETIAPRRLFPIVAIGYMANNVLPLRAGEVVRAYALSVRFKVRKTGSLATIAVERIFDGLTMVLFMLIASLSIALTTDLRNLFLIATGLFVVGSLLLFLMVFAADIRVRLVGLAVGLLPERFGSRVERMANSFIEGLGILRRRQDLAIVAGASVLAWTLEASMYLMIAEGFNLNLSPSAILMVTAVANLATLIPSSPGYVGPFEAGVMLVLAGALGIQREAALSYAVVTHAALYFPITLLGFFFWWRESLSWREIQREEAISETSP
ncbi:lysylphosphatidylglycerol synthase transmembrane domain-containing protein [soil metagenome]